MKRAIMLFQLKLPCRRGASRKLSTEENLNQRAIIARGMHLGASCLLAMRFFWAHAGHNLPVGQELRCQLGEWRVGGLPGAASAFATWV